MDLAKRGLLDICFYDAHDCVTDAYTGALIEPEPVAINLAAILEWERYGGNWHFSDKSQKSVHKGVSARRASKCARGAIASWAHRTDCESPPVSYTRRLWSGPQIPLHRIHSSSKW